MQQPTCLSCQHFRRHYVLSDDYATTTNCGHCVLGRCKHRRPGTPACQQYQAGDGPLLPNRDRVLHYLTVELLEHIHSLSLPPKIES